MPANGTARPSESGAVAHAIVEGFAGVEFGVSYVLDEALHHHLARVRRLRSSESITVSNGAGLWQLFRVGEDFGNSAQIWPDGVPISVEPPTWHIVVGIALSKGEKPELAVQKLTELGVDHISLFHGERSIARWDDQKVHRNLDRLRVVAKEAVQQSRSVFAPTVSWSEDLAGFGRWVGESYPGTGFWRADQLGEPLRGSPQLPGQSVRDACAVAIGPEGGWSDAERSQGRAAALARDVLRAETAAIVAAALLSAARSSLLPNIG